jgi:DNA invertase Pin-like site-specific DNA recombinase
MARIAYLRVSARDQSVDMQKAALGDCDRYFSEHVSGTTMNRPELLSALDSLESGDVLLVYSLSRLARSIKDLCSIVETIQRKGAALKSAAEALDTSTPAGRFMLNMLGCMAQFEAEIIKERTLAGLAEARKQGRIGGRPRKNATQCA